MSTPADPETEQTKHPNAVHFTVDGEPLEIETNSLTMSEILALVGKKPDQWYLLKEIGGEQREFRDPDEEITIGDHSTFMAEEQREHPVTIVIDTKDILAPSHTQTARELLALVGEIVETDYLVRLKGKRDRVSYQQDPDKPIHLHKDMKFITVSLGPTPVS